MAREEQDDDHPMSHHIVLLFDVAKIFDVDEFSAGYDTLALRAIIIWTQEVKVVRIIIKVHHKNNGKMTFNIGEEAVGGA